MSIDTTHFKLASQRHGWNWSQNASDRKGLLSFGCSLEQLELLDMLESHIERLERLEKVARDLAALSKDRQDGGEMVGSTSIIRSRELLLEAFDDEFCG